MIFLILKQLLNEVQNTLSGEGSVRREKPENGNQEVVESLKVELHIAQEEAKREKELCAEEVKLLKEGFKKAYEMLEKKLQQAKLSSEELEAQNKTLHDYDLKLKGQYQNSLKETSEDYLQKFIVHRDIMNSIVQEARKVKEEMGLYKEEHRELQEQVYGRYMIVFHRLEELVQNVESSFHESKKTSIVEVY